MVQSYENFTGGVLMSLVEHGFFAAEEANEFLTLENLIAPTGRLPLNTSGGNLAECYMHGLELQIEAVRQLRGQSTSQVPGAHVAMVISGPMVTPVSSMILGTEDDAVSARHVVSAGGPAAAPCPKPDGLDRAVLGGHAARRAARSSAAAACRGWQWGPEWICHRCLGFDLQWVAVAPRGRIYSWERAWHPVHPALAWSRPLHRRAGRACPTRAASGWSAISSAILSKQVTIGAAVEAVFEPHDEAAPPFTLVQWRKTA